MSSMDDDQPNPLFSQRHGYEELPKLMEIEYFSPELRKDIWRSIDDLLNRLRYHVHDEIEEFMKADPDPAIEHEYMPEFYFQSHIRNYYFDRFVNGSLRDIRRMARTDLSGDSSESLQFIENTIRQGEFYKVLSLLERLLNEDMVVSAKSIFNHAVDEMSKNFEYHRAAYRLEYINDRYEFIPFTLFVERDDILDAVNVMQENGMTGALNHCNKARIHINEGNYADSLRESVHMVESIARSIRSDLDKKTLSTIINQLQRTNFFKHSALAETFKKIYGYASNVEGARHSETNKPSTIVGPHEALLVFVACSALSNYLINRNKEDISESLRMKTKYGRAQCRVERIVDGVPVKLFLKKRQDVERPWWTLCWRTNYLIGNSNRRFYIAKGDCWVIPADVALEMIDEIESLGGLREEFFDHRGESSPNSSVSTGMAADEKIGALERITGPNEDWGVAPFFVICSDPSHEWKKVLLINTETNIATFRSITENPSYKPKKVLRPNAGWWLDNSMMDANVQQMRVFQSQLRSYLA